MLSDIVHKALATGLGFAWFTADKAERLVGTWVREGSISLAERTSAIEMVLKEAEAQQAQLQHLVSTQIDKALNMAGLARRSDIKAIEERLSALERVIGSTSQGNRL